MGCSLITIAEIIYYGFFRFLINLKLINVDGKYTNRPKKPGKQFANRQGEVQVQHIYRNNAFMY